MMKLNTFFALAALCSLNSLEAAPTSMVSSDYVVSLERKKANLEAEVEHLFTRLLTKGQSKLSWECAVIEAEDILLDLAEILEELGQVTVANEYENLATTLVSLQQSTYTWYIGSSLYPFRSILPTKIQEKIGTDAATFLATALALNGKVNCAPRGS